MEASLPDHQWWYGKWKLSWNTYYTLHVHVVAPLAQICMLSRCLVTKFQHRSSAGSLLRVRCWLGSGIFLSSFSISPPLSPLENVALNAHSPPPLTFFRPPASDLWPYLQIAPPSSSSSFLPPLERPGEIEVPRAKCHQSSAQVQLEIKYDLVSHTQLDFTLTLADLNFQAFFFGSRGQKVILTVSLLCPEKRGKNLVCLFSSSLPERIKWEKGGGGGGRGRKLT